MDRSHDSTSDVEKLMRQLNLDPLPPVMAQKKPIGTYTTTNQQVITNIHGVKVPPNLQVYRFDVTIQAIKVVNGNEKTVDLTKKAKSDSIVTNRKDLCRHIFLAAVGKYPDRFGPINKLCYDLQSTLFSGTQITQNPEGEDFEIAEESALLQEKLPESRATMKIKPVKEARVLDATELARFSSNLEDIDHSLQQYLELETSQTALMNPGEHVTYPGGKSFLMNPNNYGFTDRDAPALGHSKFLGIGCQKSIRFIEGPSGAGHKRAGCVIDTKKTPFHQQQPMVQAASGIINMGNRTLNNLEIDHLKTAFVGLAAETLHDNPAKTITIHNISVETAESKRISTPDGEITVEQYFQNRYNIPLQFPKLNLVVESGPQKSEFPMELLRIADNQRVRTEHQTPELVQNMIRACAVPPAILIPQNNRNGLALGLYGANRSPHLDAMGIEVMDRPVTLTSRVLPPPYILYNNNQQVLPEPARATWGQRSPYLVPCELGKWAIYILGTAGGRNRSKFELQELNQFLSCFQQQCVRVGITYVPPAYQSSIPIDVNQVEAEFKACKDDGYTFMFFIHADHDLSMHKVVKLMERKYEIVTQLVKMQNAGDIVSKGKQQTMENIIHKTNIKLGGVNYELRLPQDVIAQQIGNDTLCIGISLNHPGAINPTLRSVVGSAPTIVGYAANDKQHAFEFVGSFRLQKPSKEERVTVLGEIVKECFERFKTNRGKYPGKLVIFRNGCSEGQFKMVLSTEIPFAVGAIRDLKADTKMTVIVPNRMHNLRFMLAGSNERMRPPEQNVRPGTIVDTVVTHPTFNEFYLNPHVALQGTAKTPRFTVLLDQNDFSNDVVQSLCYTLCFGHQIVRLPTSLPAPVYIATRYAERGRVLLNASSTLIDNGNGDAFVQLAAELPYYHSPVIRDLRINA